MDDASTSIELLHTIPDWHEGPRLPSWLRAGLYALQTETATELARATADLIRIDGEAVAALCAPSPLGKYADSSWRRFAAGLLLADLACYSTAADQVDFERLLFVLHRFAKGFRLWALRDKTGALLPVGYTGWYPVAESTFAQLERADPILGNRLIAPLATNQPRELFLYLFNYSIVKPLRKTTASRRLVSALADDITLCAPRGLSTITVSADGTRVAERFGMRATGSLQFEGLTESVLTARFG